MGQTDLAVGIPLAIIIGWMVLEVIMDRRERREQRGTAGEFDGRRG